MQGFKQFMEEVQRFPDEFDVSVHSPYIDQPTLTIPQWGSIRLFFSSGYGGEPHWVVHMISGYQPGAGTVLYFAALLWALTEGEKALARGREKPSHGWIASDSTLSPDAVRARTRMQTQYRDYLMVKPNPNADGIKVHRNDKTDWRRPATPEEASMWRLAKMPPFGFKFH